MRVSAGQKSFFITVDASVLLTACLQSPYCDLAAAAWALLHACCLHGLQHILSGSDTAQWVIGFQVAALLRSSKCDQ
jgi:hypothetical protein